MFVRQGSKTSPKRRSMLFFAEKGRKECNSHVEIYGHMILTKLCQVVQTKSAAKLIDAVYMIGTWLILAWNR